MKKADKAVTSNKAKRKQRKAPPAQRPALRPTFYRHIAEALRNARANAYRAVNSAMVDAYWNIGRMIVEEQQRGQGRAEYGSALLKNLSIRLTREFGKGFTETNLKYFRQFYQAFPAQTASGIRHTLCDQLAWSHYRLLMRVEKPAARAWYLKEAADQNWSVRALERQINSLYYERLLMSRDKAAVTEEMQQKTVPLAPTPQDFIKDPYVLEFLDIPDAYPFREAALEQAIIDQIQAFLLELGKGFAFVARQKRISTETKDFYIDLVFYNYLLKCFVLIDLKSQELSHQDIGQMDMYVRLYEDKIKAPEDNPTVGIILCTDKDQTVVKYSILEESQHLFAAKYQMVLPTEEELQRELERERDLFIKEQQAFYQVSNKILSAGFAE